MPGPARVTGEGTASARNQASALVGPAPAAVPLGLETFEDNGMAPSDRMPLPWPELLAKLPERITQRINAELTHEFVRLCRSDQ